jgi:uncharacterized protein YndB with AHSA1/START domain
MEQKTKVNAENNRQDLIITREFDLPLELAFKSFAVAEFVEHWMGTKVLKLESKKHGSYQFETTDPKGNKHRFNGVIHEFTPNQKITRTFEMENTPFGVQLEVYRFEPLGEERCQLHMHVVYESVEQRDQVLKLPFTQGINIAHNRIEAIFQQSK